VMAWPEKQSCDSETCVHSTVQLPLALDKTTGARRQYNKEQTSISIYIPLHRCRHGSRTDRRCCLVPARGVPARGRTLRRFRPRAARPLVGGSSGDRDAGWDKRPERVLVAHYHPACCRWDSGLRHVPAARPCVLGRARPVGNLLVRPSERALFCLGLTVCCCGLLALL
jgi:hypothetical protein